MSRRSSSFTLFQFAVLGILALLVCLVVGIGGLLVYQSQLGPALALPAATLPPAIAPDSASEPAVAAPVQQFPTLPPEWTQVPQPTRRPTATRRPTEDPCQVVFYIVDETNSDALMLDGYLADEVNGQEHDWYDVCPGEHSIHYYGSDGLDEDRILIPYDVSEFGLSLKWVTVNGSNVYAGDEPYIPPGCYNCPGDPVFP